jgi:hypothetical protein
MNSWQRSSSSYGSSSDSGRQHPCFLEQLTVLQQWLAGAAATMQHAHEQLAAHQQRLTGHAEFQADADDSGEHGCIAPTIQGSPLLQNISLHLEVYLRACTCWHAFKKLITQFVVDRPADYLLHTAAFSVPQIIEQLPACSKDCW